MPTKERRQKEAARKKQGTVTLKLPVETEGQTDEAAVGAPQDAEAEAELEAARDTLPARAEARIKRYHPEEGKDIYVGVTSPSVINHRWMMENLGGGHYTISLYKQKGSDRRLSYDSRMTIDVDTKIPRKVPPWAQATEPVAPAPAAAPANGTHVSFLDAQVMSIFQMQQQQHAAALAAQQAQQQSQLEIQRQGNMMLQAFIERMAAQAAPAPPPPPPTDLMPLVTALLANRRDPVELLAELETIRAKSAAPTATDTMLSLFERGMAIGSRTRSAPVTAEPTSDNEWVGLIKSATPEVVGLVKQLLAGRIAVAQAQAQVRPPTVVPPPAGPPTGPTMRAADPPALASAPSAPAEESASDMMPAWKPFVKPHVPLLLAWAQKDYDPEVYATVLLNAIDEAGHMALAEPLLLNVAFPLELLAVFPDLQRHAQWFGELFAAVRAELTAPPGDVGDDELPDDAA